MNKAFEKIIEKLEEIRVKKTCNKEKCDEKEICRICVVDDAIGIVKKEAEQYNNAIIDGNYCFQSCACTEKCDKCSRLCNGDIDWYENIDNWTEEYNNGWIPCSERLPKYGEVVMCSCTNGGITISCITHRGEKQSKIVRFGQHSVIAWKPLPQPYQPKGD